VQKTGKDTDHGLCGNVNCQQDNKVIDVHVHIMGPGDSGKGCKMSKEFIFGTTFASMLSVFRTTPFDVTDEMIKEMLVNMVDTSEMLDYAVLHSIDGVYKNARYLEHESQLVVSNDYVIDIARTHKRVLFGASVHPYREAKEMMDEAKRCIDEGAVLFNWLPSSQQIDPEDDRCIPFYLCLAREGIPLLCHAGMEFATWKTRVKNYQYNDPKKLKRALDIGVKVIAAPCGLSHNGSLLYADGRYFADIIEILRVAEKKKWEFYVDISALRNPAKMPYLGKIKTQIDRGMINPARFLYGSDFPMPMTDVLMQGIPVNINELLDYMRGRENLLDHNVGVFRDYDIPGSLFTNAWNVLRRVK
jgi:uncharacterized protein